MKGMRARKAAEGIEDYDVNRDASRQEMRAYVCGQCHVENYFKGEEKRLVYPWKNGLKVNQILAYYDKEGFKDWEHKESGALRSLSFRSRRRARRLLFCLGAWREYCLISIWVCRALQSTPLGGFRSGLSQS